MLNLVTNNYVKSAYERIKENTNKDSKKLAETIRSLDGDSSSASDADFEKAKEMINLRNLKITAVNFQLSEKETLKYFHTNQSAVELKDEPVIDLNNEIQFEDHANAVASAALISYAAFAVFVPAWFLVGAGFHGLMSVLNFDADYRDKDSIAELSKVGSSADSVSLKNETIDSEDKEVFMNLVKDAGIKKSKMNAVVDWLGSLLPNGPLGGN